MKPLLLLISSMIMQADSFSGFRADEIYRTGPETLVAQATTVAAGPISGYSRRVGEQSEPGPDGLPMRWTASGRVERPQILKGPTLPGPLEFSRPEWSIFLPPQPSGLYWEPDYGDLEPDGKVVLFFGPDVPAPEPRAVPSGEGERDLIALVREVVRVRAIAGERARADQWLSTLKSAPTDALRKVALRSLVAIPVGWDRLEPALEDLVRNPRLSRPMRAFGFGIAAWGVTQETWGEEDRPAVVDSLGRAFVAEPDAKLALQYLYSLELILTYADDEDFRDRRRPLRQRVVDALRRRPSLKVGAGPAADPSLEEQYQQRRRKYVNP